MHLGNHPPPLLHLAEVHSVAVRRKHLLVRLLQPPLPLGRVAGTCLAQLQTRLRSVAGALQGRPLLVQRLSRRLGQVQQQHLKLLERHLQHLEQVQRQQFQHLEVACLLLPRLLLVREQARLQARLHLAVAAGTRLVARRQLQTRLRSVAEFLQRLLAADTRLVVAGVPLLPVVGSVVVGSEALRQVGSAVAVAAVAAAVSVVALAVHLQYRGQAHSKQHLARVVKTLVEPPLVGERWHEREDRKRKSNRDTSTGDQLYTTCPLGL